MQTWVVRAAHAGQAWPNQLPMFKDGCVAASEADSTLATESIQVVIDHSVHPPRIRRTESKGANQLLPSVPVHWIVPAKQRSQSQVSTLDALATVSSSEGWVGGKVALSDGSVFLNPEVPNASMLPLSKPQNTFRLPMGVAVTPDGDNIIVVDNNQHQIIVLQT